jgi:hypothetical protein
MTKKEKACKAFTIGDRFDAETIKKLVNAGARAAAERTTTKAVTNPS